MKHTGLCFALSDGKQCSDEQWLRRSSVQHRGGSHSGAVEWNLSLFSLQHNILTCHWRHSTGVANNIKDGFVLSECRCWWAKWDWAIVKSIRNTCPFPSAACQKGFFLFYIIIRLVVVRSVSTLEMEEKHALSRGFPLNNIWLCNILTVSSISARCMVKRVA